MQLYKDFIFDFKAKKFIILIIIKFIINIRKGKKIISFFSIKSSFIFEIRYYKRNIITLRTGFWVLAKNSTRLNPWVKSLNINRIYELG